ncbi:PIN domain-like protein [Neolentinus lepideus HHB14362 ss-1]|uniref:U three protein 23 n=1 Tax=Neolentinus lepideus HHB14362 ss-1 TaxID=1314782 RepID=A0A165VXH4_9AGAM|nr:PIN domain-like protein [Neolentinus lepideus HHB14362 ss-1]
MRQKRAKTYRKLMSLYCLHFGFRQPYQVLVDSEMCKEATSSHLELAKQLGVVLQGNVKPMITQCCIHELYLQGRSQQPAVDLAKTFERRKCNHREAISGDECLASVVGDTNKHRYVIATQSQPLRSKLRKIPGVPLIHINRSVVVLEPPSDATLEKKETEEEQALLVPDAEKAHLPPIASTIEPPKKKCKGPKGPNPLSVKKKKTKSDTSVSPANTASREFGGGQVGSKRKREDADVSRDEALRMDGDVGLMRKRRRKHKPATREDE